MSLAEKVNCSIQQRYF